MIHGIRFRGSQAAEPGSASVHERDEIMKIAVSKQKVNIPDAFKSFCMPSIAGKC